MENHMYPPKRKAERDLTSQDRAEQRDGGMLALKIATMQLQAPWPLETGRDRAEPPREGGSF